MEPTEPAAADYLFAIRGEAGEERLADLVTRDSMIGTGFPKRPDEVTS